MELDLESADCGDTAGFVLVDVRGDAGFGDGDSGCGDNEVMLETISKQYISTYKRKKHTSIATAEDRAHFYRKTYIVSLFASRNRSMPSSAPSFGSLDYRNGH